MDRFVSDDINVEDFSEHIERTYGIRVDGMAPLDAGVYRIGREAGPAWVARVFPESRPIQSIHRDAVILSRLAQAGFPAERLAHAQAVSLWEGRGVLMTEYVEGPPGERRHPGI